MNLNASKLPSRERMWLRLQAIKRSRTIKREKILGVILFVFLAFFISSFYISPLGKYTFSPDEIFVVGIAKEGISAILTYHKTNIDPPLERIILYPFTRVNFIQKEFVLRLPYLIFSLLTLYVVFLFTKRITKSKTFGIVACLVCAGMFYFFRYSQEVRYYHIYSFFFLLSNYIFFDLLFYKSNPTKKNWLKLLAINTLSFFFNILTLFNIAVQSIVCFFLLAMKRTKVSISAYFSYLSMFSVLVLPWFVYNDKIKIAVYSLFSFQSPATSILGGIDWLKPRGEINFFKFFFGTLQNIFVDKFSFLIIIALMVSSLFFTARKYRAISNFLLLSALGNYFLFFLATIYLIPGVISDPGSSERRLVFVLPLIAVLLALGLYSLTGTKKFIFFLFLLTFWVLQVFYAYRWISYPNPQERFLFGVDSKKHFLGVRDVVIFIQKNKSDYDEILIIDAYSTGDAVASYYFNEAKLKYSWVLPEEAKIKGNKTLVVSYENIGIDSLPFNKDLKKTADLGRYNLYEVD